MLFNILIYLDIGKKSYINNYNFIYITIININIIQNLIN